MQKVFKTFWMFLISITIFLFSLFTFNKVVFAESEEIIQDLNSLKNAITNKVSKIRISNDIQISEVLELNDYEGIINGDGHVLKSENLNDSIFKINGGNVKFNSIILDGSNQSRLLEINNHAVVTIDGDSKLLNGSSRSDTNNSEGGALKVNFSTLNILNSTLSQNTSYKNENVNKQFTESHGGAIYGNSSTINLDTVVLKDNKVGDDGYGQGGAIYIDGKSNLNIKGSDFINNRLFTYKVVTGGSIYASDKSVVTISKNDEGKRTNFKIVPPFNTGGAIRLLDSTAVIDDTDFTIAEVEGKFDATSGGAIMSEGSSLTINRSNFNSKSKLEFAGGFIGVVGEIKKFEINDSIFIGRGKLNGQGLATYGGAICFESLSDKELEQQGKHSYTYGNAKITGSKFLNLHADDWGGAIALTTKYNEKNKVNLEIVDSYFDQTGTLFWGEQYGGAIAVGRECSLILDNTKLNGSTSSIGGSIFNQGLIVLKNKTSLTNNLGYRLAGAIYNDGYLEVDEATFSGNQKGDWSTGNSHPNSLEGKPEFAGENIYANKDVIITPKAVFDEKDIRILDGQSSILLTGELNKKINISISENKKENSEQQIRKVGYIVAKGKDGYQPTKIDANFLNYISKDNSQDISKYEDDKETGKWDCVLNPEEKIIVLGQRISVVYHANANGTDSREAIFPLNENVSIISKPVVIYKKGIILRILKDAPKPVRNYYNFVNWYKEAVTDQDVKQNPNNKLIYDIFDDTREIINNISPSEINVYAGWNITKSISIAVTKKWENVSEDTKTPEVIIQLLQDGQETGKQLTLNKENNYKSSFNDLAKYQQDGVKEIQYTIKEVAVDGYTSKITGNQNDGYVVINTKDTPIYGDILVKKQNDQDSYYSTTHEETFKVKPGELLTFKSTIDGSKIKEQINREKEKFGTSLVDALKDKIKISNAKLEFVTKIIPATGLQFPDPSKEEGKAKYTFGPKPFLIKDIVKQNDGTIDVYMTIDTTKISTFAALEKELVEEHKVDNLTLTVEGVKVPDDAKDKTLYTSFGEIKGTFSATASFNFLVRKHMGPYNWKAVQDKEIPETNLDGTDYLLNQATDLEKQKIQATIEVINPSKINLAVTKKWENVSEDTKTPEVIIQLLQDGQETGKQLTLNKENNYKSSFNDLAKYQQDGVKEIQYTIKEVAVDGYTSKITGNQNDGYVVINTKRENPFIVIEKPSKKITLPNTGIKNNICISVVILATGLFVMKKNTKNEDNN